MPERIVIVGLLLLCGSWSASCRWGGSAQPLIPVGFWFEAVTPASVALVSDRLGASFTADDLRRIEATARQELHIAFENTRLHFSDSRTSTFRVRVVPQFTDARTVPVAGESRSFGGIRGDGVVNFNIVALSALAFASDAADREALVQAIGRGIGRTAVHELAHQVLGPAEMDGTEDRFSYEHADLRPEHFYAALHWGPAASRLQQRIGR